VAEHVVVYDAGSQLRRPRQFLRSLRQDFVVSRGVAWRLFLRDIRSQHRRSLLGYLWIILPATVTAAAWIFLHESGVVATGDVEVSYPVYVFIGVSLWQGFLDALNAPFNKLGAAQGLMTKFKLPAEAFILIGLADVLFNFTVRMVLVAVVYFVWGPSPHWTLVLVPLGAVALVGLGTAIGSLLAPLGTLFADVQRALALITTVWFFVTPIVYDTDKIGDAQVLNPVSVLLVTTRDWMLVGDTRWPLAFVVVLTLTLVALPATFVLFRLAAPHLVDRAST
jgi:lipopolysaccharide transport system permease protein